ncbi:UDP-N-acetylmuramate dehydrogenase [Pareuzebyella sediminis]|uniref:UDP-N-acetylmuramate dehydrogenase n=1 Tax=Pareuzebyella sediminis TaxID=2607998 RepID=UPI0011EE22ED|nr:UDP-N-acetylmuramate dehydrogenase [Pareuzebyella sediminis]
MDVQTDVSLKPYNTFGIDARARFFCEIDSLKKLKEALQLSGYPEKFILSGGSNILITGDLNKLVLHIGLKGIEIVEESQKEVWIKVMAGENWHQMVLWALDQNYGGLENLSLIPGNAGTAPIQNIGAYGVELKDILTSCEAMEVESKKIKIFTNEDCHFGYRDSYFKNEGKGKYVITSITLKLTKNTHKINTNYGDIEAELQAKGISDPTIKDISNVVVSIRQKKLPDPCKIGNSGSFFKNPVLSASEFLTFTENHPHAPFYKIAEDCYKIPAGWLIEQCGLKGKRFGDAGVHKNQALVLVNYGHATGKDIINMAERVVEQVRQKFGITISPEVNIIS